MKLHRWLAASAMVLVLSAAPVLAQDAKETLQAIPSDALGFVYTGRLDQSNEKLHTLLKQLKVPVPDSPLDLAKKALGVSKGLNGKASAAVILFPPEEGEMPTPVGLVPVSNYKEFVAQFELKDLGDGISEFKLPTGPKMAVAQKGKFAVLAYARNFDTLKKYLTSSTNLTAWAQPLQTWLDENDLAAVVTARGVKYYIGKVRAELAKKAGQGAPADPTALMFASLERVLKSVESDVTHAGLAVKLDKAGNLHLDVRALFAKGSGLAKEAAAMKVPEGGPLAGLPQGPFAVAVGGAVPENVMKALVNLLGEAMKKDPGNLPAEKLDKLHKALSQILLGIRGAGLVVSEVKPGDFLLSGWTSIMKVDNAPGYIDSYEKALLEITSLDRNQGKIFATKRAKIAKISVLEITSDFMPRNAGDLPPNIMDAQRKALESVFGNGGKMTMSMAAIDGSTVLTTYHNAEEMKDLIKTRMKVTAGLKDDVKVATTLAALPQGSQWVVLVNPKATMDMARQFVKTVDPNAPPDVIPAFPQTSLVAVGARLSETGLVIHAVTPVQVLEEIGKLVAKGR